MQPRPHQKTDWTFLSQLVPRELHGISRRVTQLLSGREDVDPLVQELTRLFFVYAILSHEQEDLD